MTLADDTPPVKAAFVVDLEPEPLEAVEAARAAFRSGRTRPLRFRKEQLRGLERFLAECEDDVVAAVHQDLGKHRQEVVMGELDLLRHDVRHTLLELKGWMRPERPAKSWVNVLDGVVVYSDPYGVVLVIGAWNYPMLLAVGPLIGAIAGGNCVILKPSELAPATAALLAARLPRYLDAKCYHVVCGGVDAATRLLQTRFDYIFFTGSTAVGRIVHQAAARFLTPTTLELGGKCPVYLDDSVSDMRTAARRILWGKCLNAGQTCIAPDYLLCSKAAEGRFLAAARAVLRVFYGEEAAASPCLTRILSERHYDRLMALVGGATVAIGGTGDRGRRVIAPTVLVGVKGDDAIMREEIFGPVLPVVNVESAQEAVDFVNAREKPLALYVFTERRDVRGLFLNGTSSGNVTVNDTIMHILTENLPFGGVGGSGMGNYHGKYGFDTFTHKKGTIVRSLGFLTEKTHFARYPPYSRFKTALLSALTAKRRSMGCGWLKWVAVFGLGVAFAYGVQWLKEDEDQSGRSVR